jgi:drug/metabolite transporter (DMT)-like permease
MVIACSLGRERFTVRRFVSLMLGIAGALVLVLGGSGSFSTRVLGNVFFFFNCLGTALYLIMSKPILAQMAPTNVVFNAYLFASLLMFLTNVVVNRESHLVAFLCPDCEGAWHVPLSSLLTIMYWVIVCTAIGWGLMTQANKTLPSSVVAFYTCCQPMTSATMTVVFLLCGKNPGNSLEMPGWNMLGCIGIIGGLVLTATENQ